jgi:ssDNA-binding Zn-finger/Zn-ribbon topoisomerase 1
MPRRAPKTAVVAFKVEQELADLLDKLPNKSEFIRKAIAAQLGVACPLCRGKGVIARGVHQHYAPIIAANNLKACANCASEVPVPLHENDLAEEQRERLEQFFLGGPLYCDACYDKAPECHDCGWHVTPEQIHEHVREAHSAD